MRNEIFSHINNNRKQYYTQLRNQNSSKLSLINSAKTQKNSSEFTSDLPPGTTTSLKQEIAFQSLISVFRKLQVFLSNTQETEILRKYSNYFRSSKQKVIFLLASFKIFYWIYKPIIYFFAQFQFFVISKFRKINTQFSLLSDNFIDKLNELGNYIFNEESSSQQESSNKSGNTNMTVVIKTDNYWEIPVDFILAWPDKLRLAIRDIIIFFETDLLTFSNFRSNQNSGKQKSVTFKANQKKVKTISEIYKELRARLAQVNLKKQTDKIANSKVYDTSDNKLSTHAFFSFPKKIKQYLNPLINRFI